MWLFWGSHQKRESTKIRKKNMKEKDMGTKKTQKQRVMSKRVLNTISKVNFQMGIDMTHKNSFSSILLP